MGRLLSFRSLFIGGALVLALAVTPAQAHHAHGTDIVVPLATLLAFGARYHHGHHNHYRHHHYYRSYKRHHRHHHGYHRGHGHHKKHKRHSHSHGGYHRYKH